MIQDTSPEPTRGTVWRENCLIQGFVPGLEKTTTGRSVKMRILHF